MFMNKPAIINKPIKQPKTGLIIIDMQPRYLAAKNKETIAGCIAQIEIAAKESWPVFFVEFRETSPWVNKGDLDTVREIKDAADRLKICPVYVYKQTPDGSPGLLSSITYSFQHLQTFRFCGVYSSCCVRATVYGFSTAIKFFNPRKKFKLEIVANAVNDSNEESPQRPNIDCIKSADPSVIIV